MPVTMPDKFFTPGEDTYGLIGSSANRGGCPRTTRPALPAPWHMLLWGRANMFSTCLEGLGHGPTRGIRRVA